MGVGAEKLAIITQFGIGYYDVVILLYLMVCNINDIAYYTVGRYEHVSKKD